MVEVAQRDAATLIPIIQQYIRFVIYNDAVHIGCNTHNSNEWRAYSQLSSLGYQHETVKHSENFVDPTTGAHTQTIERVWGLCKSMMRKQRTMHSRLFDTYLQEYVWRKQFDTIGSNAFSNIIQHITEQYPCT